MDARLRTTQRGGRAVAPARRGGWPPTATAAKRCRSPAAQQPSAGSGRALVAGTSLQLPSRRRARSVACAAAKQGEVGALEAALAAINSVLGLWGALPKQQRRPGAPATPAKPGPSKLVRFSASAKAKVPVQETLPAPEQPQAAADAAGPPDGDGHGSGVAWHRAHRGHGHGHGHAKPAGASWFGGGSNSAKGQSSLPPEAQARSLQAYLALPLEQYSLLDPTLISRLPAGTDVEALLAELLAGQRQRREARQAARKQAEAARAAAAAAPAQGDASSSSSSSSGGGVCIGGAAPDQQRPPQLQQQPSMRPLALLDAVQAEAEAAAAAAATATTSSDGSSVGSSTSSASEAPRSAAALPAAGVPAAGAFLLRLPMQELIGVDLEPLLVIYVDIDPAAGQVTFHTDRLVVGDPRFDAEFKVDLTAVLRSKASGLPVLVEQQQEQQSSSSSGSSSSSSNAGSSEASPAPPAAAQGGQPHSQAQQQQHEQTAPTRSWQRSSSLACKVSLAMTLRLPHPLSLVPGPLLSSTAGLVARLVMKALLPSFLELLATDYRRWAQGTSTATRQAVPAGSLVAAGREHVAQLAQAEQADSAQG